MHRITDRKGVDLFPYLLCSNASIIYLVLVHSHFILFHIYWTPVLTKLLYSKGFKTQNWYYALKHQTISAGYAR